MSIMQMTFPRRTFLHLAAGAATLTAWPHRARALDYPTRPVHWILSAAPGGAADILARLMSARLSQRLGQQFIVEARPGAGGNIGTEAVVRSVPDGYTLHLTATSDAINATLYQNLGFSLERDLAPVAGLIRGPFVMVVTPSFPAKTVPEFIAYAKAHPGVINFGSGGIGFASHVAGELFKMLAGVNMVHVPYRGQGPAMTDLLGGRIQVLFDTLPAAIGNIRAGKIRALAVTSKKRTATLPDIPAMNEFVPGYEADSFHGISAPKGTPREIVDKLNKDINAILADPTLKARLVELGAEVFTGTPKDYGRYLQGEIERWAKVIEFSGAKAE